MLTEILFTLILILSTFGAGELLQLGLARFLDSGTIGSSRVKGDFDFLLSVGLNCSLGLGILGVVTLILGLAGLLDGTLIVTLVTLTGFLGIYFLAQIIRRQGARSLFQITTMGGASVVAVLIWLSLVIRMALIPGLEQDAVAYHLSLPRAWLNASSIFPLPHEPHSNWHALSNMSFIWALSFSPESLFLPKFLEIFRCLLTSILIYKLVARLCSVAAGFSALCLYLFAQEVLRYSPTAHVDAGMSVYFTLGLYYLYLAMKREGESFYLILAGTAFGFFAGVKQTGLFLYAPLPCLYFLIALYCKLPGRSLGRIMLLVLTSTLVAGPWLLKNTLYTHNPFYPFAAGAFSLKESFLIGHQHYQSYYPDGVGSFFPSPDVIYARSSYVPFNSISNLLYLLPLGTLAFLFRRNDENDKDRFLLMVIVYSWIILPLFFKVPFLRFFLSVYPAYLIVGVVSVFRLGRSYDQWWHQVCAALVSIFLIYQGYRFCYEEQFSWKRLETAPTGYLYSSQIRAVEFERRYPGERALIERIESLSGEGTIWFSVYSPAVVFLKRRFIPNVPLVAKDAVLSMENLGYTTDEMADYFSSFSVDVLVTEQSYLNGEAAIFRQRHLRELETIPLAGKDVRVFRYIQ